MASSSTEQAKDLPPVPNDGEPVNPEVQGLIERVQVSGQVREELFHDSEPDEPEEELVEAVSNGTQLDRLENEIKVLKERVDQQETEGKNGIESLRQYLGQKHIYLESKMEKIEKGAKGALDKLIAMESRQKM